MLYVLYNNIAAGEATILDFDFTVIVWGKILVSWLNDYNPLIYFTTVLEHSPKQLKWTATENMKVLISQIDLKSRQLHYISIFQPVVL